MVSIVSSDLLAAGVHDSAGHLMPLPEKKVGDEHLAMMLERVMQGTPGLKKQLYRVQLSVALSDAGNGREQKLEFSFESQSCGFMATNRMADNDNTFKTSRAAESETYCLTLSM